MARAAPRAGHGQGALFFAKISGVRANCIDVPG
jgi:hypothetical protein